MRINRAGIKYVFIILLALFALIVCSPAYMRTVGLEQGINDTAGDVAVTDTRDNDGAPCHEDRARGSKDTIALYNNMKIVSVEYDMDSVDKAYKLTKDILKYHPDVDGFICCNMSNPVGAARAVTEMKSDAVIVGMDHDREYCSGEKAMTIWKG